MANPQNHTVYNLGFYKPINPLYYHGARKQVGPLMSPRLKQNEQAETQNNLSISSPMGKLSCSRHFSRERTQISSPAMRMDGNCLSPASIDTRKSFFN